MPAKRLLRPDRLRQVPTQFSWIDQRLVRDGHIGRCNAQALALYLMLVTVADSRGLSYYGDPSITRLLTMSQEHLESARTELIRVGLIAYTRPLYQVLSLEPSEPRRISGVQSAGTLLSRSFWLADRQRRS
ncbi:MAG: hypothetical protein JWO52_6761 [Gammaproteobacteria bacterium]|jgi:hypothetical protein|nr:hypothetical protein [Gammaproteobacteria bacterium]